MHPFAQFIVTLGVAAIAGALILGALELRALSQFLRTQKLKVEVFKRLSSTSYYAVSVSPAGYAIYVFRGGEWVMEADFSNRGYQPSPPTIPGSFEGQVVKKQSVLQGIL